MRERRSRYGASLRVVIAPDKFRGTVSALECGEAIARGVRLAGGEAEVLPLADGGEGTVAALGGANRHSEVPNALGAPVMAAWILAGDTAVIELAAASGLDVLGGAGCNDPLAATSDGTAMLVLEAVQRGAARVIIGVGGSAATDGGLGATGLLSALEPTVRANIRVACDVDIPFLDSARIFGPQKGANPAQVEILSQRLRMLADMYQDRFAVDVRPIAHSGAAGGFAGGLAALGAHLEPGFDLVASRVGLHRFIADADLVITGEGRFDDQSFLGKVVGGVVGICTRQRVPVLVLAGAVEADLPAELGVAVSLAREFGIDTSLASTAECLTEMAHRCVSSFMRSGALTEQTTEA